MNRKHTIEVEPLAVQLTEAARLLNLCPQTLLAHTRSGEIPHKRLGPKVILYPIEELRTWLRSGDARETPRGLDSAA